MKKAQIQISESSSLFLPSQQPKVNENIIPIYSDKTNRQLWIKGKQKKPYILIFILTLYKFTGLMYQIYYLLEN